MVRSLIGFNEYMPRQEAAQAEYRFDFLERMERKLERKRRRLGYGPIDLSL